ncbi:DUF2515 domain-containing protein [Brevibacillus sp. NRS-1366]|uniref:DUF2515 domain-containing protein n=1 Tax=Brevibacillus sp. NRS-1366 TaxID=3233899 RepID=UPI003D1ACC50
MKWPWHDFRPLLPLQKELKKVTTPLLPHEQAAVEKIRQQTRERNGDNVDRTRAYLDYYLRRSEIHWALLAHLVSRNAGWNMTDLRGELLPRLLSAKEQTDYFSFLERGNWLIFHDVYPQLLLYEESVKRQTNLFHLLPHLQVSAFMQGVWNHFWKTGDRELLAIGLIINEQNYLEAQVMRDPGYQNTVVRTLPFTLQELMQLNQILFPYEEESRDGSFGQEIRDRRTSPIQVIGQIVSHFASLPERIALGKSLYALLFGTSAYFDGVLAWTKRQVHTGSRKDFWPHLFHDVNESVPGKPYQKKVVNCQIKQGANRLYSPTLTYAWKPVIHERPSAEDWYRGQEDVLGQLTYAKMPDASVEMGETYCKTVEKMELAVVARGKIFGTRAF